MFTLNADACRDCTNQRGNQPPCLRIRNMPMPGVILASEDAIGYTCPFKASWSDIVSYTKMIPNPGIEAGWAQKGLEFIKARLASGATTPAQCNVLVGQSIDQNNNVTYVEDRSKRLLTFLRRLNGSDWQKFWDEFQAHGFLTPVGQMGNDQKFAIVLQRAQSRIPSALAKAYADLVNPAAITIVVGVFIAMAVSPAKIVPMIKNAFMGIGLGVQFFSYADDFAKFLVGVTTATQDSGENNPQSLDYAAAALARLLASIARDLSIAALTEFIAALRKGASAWRGAAQDAQAGEHSEGAAAKVASCAKDAGMQRWHVEGWIKWAKKNGSLVVLRVCNKDSLPRHFDELVTGKVCAVKWKTAKAGRWAGLVVVPEFGKGMSRLKIVEEIVKLKKDGYKFLPPPGADGIPETGALVLGPDGRAFCSDVDKMGIYVVHNGKATPHPQWAAYNDNPQLNARLQNEVYGGGPQMDQHGGQDFFEVGVDPATGKPIMGRDPTPDEKFLIVEPDGSLLILNVQQLKHFYKSYGIAWNYRI